MNQAEADGFHIYSTTIADVAPIIRENIARETAIMTDEATWYTEVGSEFAGHETVAHSAKEYVRGHVHTDTVEGYYSIVKRGMKGVINTAKRNTFIAVLPNTISDTVIA